MGFENPKKRGEGFLENKVAAITFTCNACHHVRLVKAKKISGLSVLLTDMQVNSDENTKVYEVEMWPFPATLEDLSTYILRGHTQMFHNSTNAGIFDLRN